MAKLFQGTYTAVITPFTPSNEIDWVAFEKIIEQQIAGGITGLVFVGTTGESPTLSHDEHQEILRCSVQVVNQRCQVIHGTGSNNTRETIEFAEVSSDAGADGQLVINPYYNRPTQEGLYRHFSAIAHATDLPIIIYNIKGRTAVNLETETLLRLLTHKSIVGVKEASGDLAQIMDVIQHTPDDFCVLSGDDALTLPILACGGDGVISVVSNCVPASLCRCVQNYLDGNLATAQQQFYSLLPLMKLTMKETNPIPVKAIMQRLGYCSPQVRLPLCEPTKATQQAIEEALDSIRQMELS
ncbi:MAG: 4-hydroxy-tetrahydrodipicolinate synthase [Tunicatimonas sp.]|uniref:4-hydroxy-tetrahydrodipicolinate synthase n=1 Tax=Tunicatimonas sp. TaxID=1940096 RepID=UPI003C77D25E